MPMANENTTSATESAATDEIHVTVEEPAVEGANTTEAAAAETPEELSAKRLIRWQEKNRRIESKAKERHVSLDKRQADLDARQAQIEADAKDAAAYRALRGKAKTAPHEAVRELDLDEGELMRQRLREGTPEAALDRKLEEKLAARDAEAKKLADEQATKSAAEQEAAAEQARVSFTQKAATDPSRPELGEWIDIYGADRFRGAVKDIVERRRQTGSPFESLVEVANEMQRLARIDLSKVRTRLGNTNGQGPSANPIGERTPPQVAPAQTAARAAQGPKTLSSGLSAERTDATKSLTRDERRKIAVAAASEILRKG